MQSLCRVHIKNAGEKIADTLRVYQMCFILFAVLGKPLKFRLNKTETTARSFDKTMCRMCEIIFVCEHFHSPFYHRFFFSWYSQLVSEYNVCMTSEDEVEADEDLDASTGNRTLRSSYTFLCLLFSHFILVIGIKQSHDRWKWELVA